MEFPISGIFVSLLIALFQLISLYILSFGSHLSIFSELSNYFKILFLRAGAIDRIAARTFLLHAANPVLILDIINALLSPQ